MKHARVGMLANVHVLFTLGRLAIAARVVICERGPGAGGESGKQHTACYGGSQQAQFGFVCTQCEYGSTEQSYTERDHAQ